MIRTLTAFTLFALAAPVSAVTPALPPAPAPSEIVAAAPKADWVAIPASDLLVMDLTPPDRGPGQASTKAKPRRVTIQLMPPPFSAGWIGNIRKLAAAHWWDGLSVNRVQDNYVAQWGDADGEDKAKARALPGGVRVGDEREYQTTVNDVLRNMLGVDGSEEVEAVKSGMSDEPANNASLVRMLMTDPYASRTSFLEGWPTGFEGAGLSSRVWPVHCYGMVGVGRNLSPDTGSGAELYTVIGHAPRHLDRNIALVGRVIEGIEHLSSLPRGTGALGFYETPEERTTIISVRLGSEVSALPAYEYLSTETATFARYADARANRRDPFFIKPAGGADICNIPVPVRRVK